MATSWKYLANTKKERKGGRETERGREGERENREGGREGGRGISSKDRDRIKL